VDAIGRELFPPKNTSNSTAGQKRKAAKAQKPQALSTEEQQHGTVNSMALVVVERSIKESAIDANVQCCDSNKKPKTTPNGSADLAEAAEQPRSTQ
jgi:hypothetical protein